MAGLRKRAEKNGATLTFLDESGQMTTPVVSRTWAPRGQTPILRHRGSRKKASLISAITVHPARGQEPKLYFQVHPDKNIRTPEVIGFLKQLMRQVPGPIEVVWDQGNPHRSAEMREFLATHRERIRAHFLPSYAPELNPDEGVWGYLKNKLLPNLCPKNLDELVAHTQRALRKIQRLPTILASFFAAAGLSIKFLRTSTELCKAQ